MAKLKLITNGSVANNYGEGTYLATGWTFVVYTKWWWRYFPKQVELSIALDELDIINIVPIKNNTNVMEWLLKHVRGAVRVDIISVLLSEKNKIEHLQSMQVRFTHSSDAIKFKFYFPETL